METNKDITAIEKKCAPVVDKANALIINNEADLETAKTVVRDCRALMKEIKDTFEPMKKKASDTHKEIVAQEKKHLSPPEEAKKIVEGTIGKYADKLREEARIAEEKLQKEKEREIEKINKRMNKHLEGFKDIEGQIKTLEEKLAKPETSDVEYEIVDNQLQALIRKRDAKAETVANNQNAMEHVEMRQPMDAFPKQSELSVAKRLCLCHVLYEFE